MITTSNKRLMMLLSNTCGVVFMTEAEKDALAKPDLTNYLMNNSNILQIITGPIQFDGPVTIVQDATNPTDAVNLETVINYLGSISVIIDEEEPFTPPPATDPDDPDTPLPSVTPLLFIKNKGIVSINYELTLGGLEVPLATNAIYGYGYVDPNQPPIIIFDPNYLYAIYPDTIPESESALLTSSEAQDMLNLFTQDFANDYVNSNGNGNINIEAKNLVVAVIDGNDPIATSLSQLQIIKVSDSTVVYDAHAPLTAPGILHTSSNELVSSIAYKVIIASSNPNTVIAVASGDDPVIYKTQNFTSGDSDNSFTAPLRVIISDAA